MRIFMLTIALMVTGSLTAQKAVPAAPPTPVVPVVKKPHPPENYEDVEVILPRGLGVLKRGHGCFWLESPKSDGEIIRMAPPRGGMGTLEVRLKAPFVGELSEDGGTTWVPIPLKYHAPVPKGMRFYTPGGESLRDKDGKEVLLDRRPVPKVLVRLRLVTPPVPPKAP